MNKMYKSTKKPYLKQRNLTAAQKKLLRAKEYINWTNDQ